MNRLVFFVAALFAVLLLAASAVAQEPSAQDYVNFWRPLVGQWKSTTKINDATTVGTYTYRPSPSQRCYVAVQRIDVTSHSLDGYDAARKCWKGVGYDSRRQFIESFIRIENMDAVKQLSSGAKGTYELRLTKEDGSTTTEKGKWIWLEFDGSKGRLDLTERVEDGQQQPDMLYTLEKIDQAVKAQPTGKNVDIAKEKLRALIQIEGTWESKFTATEDIPWAGAKAGDKVCRRDRNEVLWGGTALSTEIGYVNEAGEFVVLLRELIGWDAKKEAIVSAGFWGSGSASHGTWTKTGETWKAARNEVWPSGRESSSIHELTMVDEHTYTVKRTEPAEDEVLIFKRVK